MRREANGKGVIRRLGGGIGREGKGRERTNETIRRAWRRRLDKLKRNARVLRGYGNTFSELPRMNCIRLNYATPSLAQQRGEEASDNDGDTGSTRGQALLEAPGHGSGAAYQLPNDDAQCSAQRPREPCHPFNHTTH
jgi:hypothetical protein